MSPEKQRMAIAEACGWRDIWTDKYPDKWLGVPPFEFDGLWPVPNYLNDLNAMHKAEELIMDELSIAYKGWLEQLSCPWHATAAQRAEAFLKTLDKWEN